MSDLFCEEVSMEGWRVEVSGDVCEGAELFCEGMESGGVKGVELFCEAVELFYEGVEL